MRRRLPPSSSGVVSATEVASYVYCPEQWRLQHGLGHASTNTALLARGTALTRRLRPSRCDRAGHFGWPSCSWCLRLSSCFVFFS